MIVCMWLGPCSYSVSIHLQMLSTCGIGLLGDIQLYDDVIFFFQLLSFMYGHITFYHSGKAFIVLCSLCQ